MSCCPTEDGMVLLDQRSGTYWQLNTTGAAVLRALLDGATAEEITEGLVRSRPVARERAAADVETLIGGLTRAGLVTAP
ncbi:lasso peptide biosynthesis PqqD family chaperone [Streptomyces sp. NPDC051567]|uniref:lasso peptide biosynthesis PqqD family chaperone n=1 Tax=Streptomyces sp. NPDC051567 TaxID=3365660 RepID=UPI0037AF6E09